MRLRTRRKTPTEELKSAAIEALVNALDDNKREPEPGTKGVRAVAIGAVVYTAGRAVFKRQRFLREHLASLREGDQAEDVEDEEAEEAEEYELDEEPEAYEEDEDEPDEDEDEDTGDDEPERQPTRRAARRKGAQPSLKLPNQRRPRIRMTD